MRLDRLLSELNIASRREIKDIVRKGRVSVNGETARAPELQVPDGADVRFDGHLLPKPGPVYYMLNKPAGYLTAVTDEKRPTVMELVQDKRQGLAPVGRLDLDTEGLLLITNDGTLAHALLAPKNRVPKTYYAETDVPIPPEAADILSKPVVFKDFTSLPGKYERAGEKAAFLTVFEGKYHEVKRLFHAAGCEVVYLRRVAFGGLSLGDLPKGAVRELTDEEVTLLKRSMSS